MRKLMLLAAVLLSLAGLSRADYQPVAENVTDNVYAIVGPLGQRSADNDGLNANFGFIVTDEGVILLDSGASRLGAKKLAAAIRAVTDKPVRWVISLGTVIDTPRGPGLAFSQTRVQPVESLILYCYQAHNSGCGAAVPAALEANTQWPAASGRSTLLRTGESA